MTTFTVADHGRGIPPDRLDTVFRRFEQVDSSDARDRGGSGLGLAISRSIVERHGGRIWVESTVGEGSQFKFTIPTTTAAGLNEPTVDGPTVLVCDDDPDFVSVISTVLARRGYRAIGARSGAEAIALAREEAPTAVLIDLMMSGTSGADVVAELRRDPNTKNIPLIVVSGLDPTSDRPLADETDDWLVKPINEDKLITTLRDSIADHSGRGSVLLVEDDEAVASVIITLLRRRGLQVRHAATRDQAMRIMQERPPGLLVLDLALPDGSGSGLIDSMRLDGQLRDLSMVVYSASDVSPEDQASLRLGPTVFLTKGRVSPQVLEEHVVQLIDTAVRNGFRSEALAGSGAGHPAPSDRPAPSSGPPPTTQQKGVD